MRRFVSLFCILFVVTGCSKSETSGAEVEEKQGEGKVDRWTSADDPHLFSSALELKLDELPLEGEAVNVPWAASYWPVYEDSINFRWEGEESLSPAGKYGEAFAVEDIEDKVSENHGIDSVESAEECTTIDDCSEPTLVECAKRHGAETGRCIPTWWGICHAWAPAAIMEAEPLYPVTKNGVTFKVNDIKALVTLIYNRSTSKFVSLRCNKTHDKDEIAYDGYSRPTSDDAECKDTNPGTYHLLLTNYLGLKGQSFVEDRTFDSEVWNQPLRGYRTTKLEEVTSQKANELVGVLPEGEGVSVFDGSVETNSWTYSEAIPVTAGDEIQAHLRLVPKANLFVRFGAKPDSSDFDCRTYTFSGPTHRTCAAIVPEDATEMYFGVRGEEVTREEDEEEVSADWQVTLVDVNEGAIVPEEYRFNDDAEKIYWVKTEVDYITESESDIDGNLAEDIDQYTRTDRYEYLLELDGDDKVIGGEWLGRSKTDHPDFLWLPTGVASYVPIAGGAIRPDMVRALLQESLVAPVEEEAPIADELVEEGEVSTEEADPAEENPEGENSEGENETPSPEETSELPEQPVEPVVAGIEHLDISGDVELAAMLYYTLELPADSSVTITLTGTKDVDLYLRMNLAPTEMMYDNRSFTPVGDETLTFKSETGGVLYIGVHGYLASDFHLVTTDAL